MRAAEYVPEAIKAEYDPDDIELALVGSFDQRKLALMRLLSSTWKKGWDECDAEYKQVLGRAAFAAMSQTGRPS
jgi:hypothetical protein